METTSRIQEVFVLFGPIKTFDFIEIPSPLYEFVFICA